MAMLNRVYFLHLLQVVDIRMSTETLGVQVLKARGFFAEARWYWIGVGGLLGYIFLLNGLFALALTYLDRKDEPHYPSISCTSSTNIKSLHEILVQHSGVTKSSPRRP